MSRLVVPSKSIRSSGYLLFDQFPNQPSLRHPPFVNRACLGTLKGHCKSPVATKARNVCSVGNNIVEHSIQRIANRRIARSIGYRDLDYRRWNGFSCSGLRTRDSVWLIQQFFAGNFLDGRVSEDFSSGTAVNSTIITSGPLDCFSKSNLLVNKQFACQQANCLSKSKLLLSEPLKSKLLVQLNLTSNLLARLQTPKNPSKPDILK